MNKLNTKKMNTTAQIISCCCFINNLKSTLGLFHYNNDMYIMNNNNNNNNDTQQTNSISCRLVHHGAAAAVSGNQIVTWMTKNNSSTNKNCKTADDTSSSSSSLSSSTMVYASNAILNITDTVVVTIPNSNHNKKDWNDDASEQQRQGVETLSISSAKPTTTSIVRHVQETLRCTEMENATVPSISSIVITCVVTAKYATTTNSHNTALVTGFSNGMIQVWLYDDDDNSNDLKVNDNQTKKGLWTEHTVTKPTVLSVDQDNHDNHLHQRSITSIDAIWTTRKNKHGSDDHILQIAAGTSAGMIWYQCKVQPQKKQQVSSTISDVTASPENCRISTSIRMNTATTKLCGAVASLQFTTLALFHNNNHDQAQSSSNILLLLVGTAAPRNNKIHVYQCDCHLQHHLATHSISNHSPVVDVQYSGYLTGHEDWVTSLACWNENQNNNNENNSNNSFLLASGSQDARIRIWKFRTIPTITNTTVTMTNDLDETDPLIKDIDDDEEDDEFLDDIGESRLEIVHKINVVSDDENNYQTAAATTSVTLEALLYGHEEGVTSVTWHPNPKSLYGIDRILISSSTDRTILLWSETKSTDDSKPSNYGGIWTPLSRVGSAGGILGGSIGSTLLGFCGITVEPTYGRTLVGHAYGGALHIWDVIDVKDTNINSTMQNEVALVQWKASPCITGHFAGITDCCWEASNGDYLLTVSNDQTCRIWAQLKTDLLVGESSKAWLELARPQVHGYNLSAVASLSTSIHPHVIVTGADEKEIRVFDAPKGTLRLLNAFSDVKRGGHNTTDTLTNRVERAYIPSLGLSNKASPADAAAEDDENEDESKTSTLMLSRLPLERDLGAVSLWPENQKLFGHNTEIYCLAASVAGSINDVLLASSCKARDAEDAKIRLWNVQTGQCVQILSEGHRSTVATMSFSTDGQYLASSGKDRRLCLWRKQPKNTDASSSISMFELVWALDSAHKRIVWAVDFCAYDTKMLVSGSRDGIVKVWSIQDDNSVTEMVHFSPTFKRNGKSDAVTALAVAPTMLSSKLGDVNNAIIAIGLESGRIELWCIPYTKNATSLQSATAPYPMSCFDPSICHCDTVTKLTWRPLPKNTTTLNNDDTKTSTVLHLASCSMDHGCRIFEIEFP